VLERVYAYPRELVFAAWTDPKQIGRWWGPDGFTTTVQDMDVRPGGTWRFIMHGPDGTDYHDIIVYSEVTPPERLVYVHGEQDGSEEQSFEVIVTFTEEAGGTRVVMRSLFSSPAAREAVEAFGAVELGKQTLAHLDGHLASRQV
jgi:uncharacterized protein YndB with AHSA1/START domain